MSNGIQEEAIFPGLPRFIAQSILARAPRGAYPSLRLVSRSWREALRPESIFSVRAQERHGENGGGGEAWLYMTTQLQGPFHAFDPWSNAWQRNLAPIPSDHMFTVSDKECFVAGRELFVVGPHLNLSTLRMQAVIFRYSLDTDAWAVAPSMLRPRSLFASASSPWGAAYVAGGVAFGTRTPLRSAEFLDRGRWMQIPDMIHARKECSGFFLGNRFFVIGGSDEKDDPLSDGECYDPATRRWSLVRGLWSDPERLQGGTLAPPLVAVIRDELFAWDHPHGLLKRYNFSSGIWEAFNAAPPPGRLPNPQSRGWGIGFKGVGDELWLIGGSVAYIDACRPGSGGGVNWRRVTPTWGARSFVYNCAVMKA